MSTEADTCRRYVLPKLYAAGWNDDQICEQRTFTDGRIVPTGGKVFRRSQKQASRLRSGQKDFFDQYQSNVRATLGNPLDTYGEHGEVRSVLPDVLQIVPMWSHGNVIKIANLFGGPVKLSDAMNQMQMLLRTAQVYL